MERKLGVTRARREFGEIVDRVQHQGDAYIVTRHGKPALAMVPVEVYTYWKKERERLFETIRAIQRDNPDADPDQVMRDVLEAQQALRRES